MIQSSGGEFVPTEEAEGLLAVALPKMYRVVQAQDHGFNGNTDGFFQTLREELAWVNTAR